MAKAYVTTILLGLTIWTAPTANALWIPPNARSVASGASDTTAATSDADSTIHLAQYYPPRRRVWDDPGPRNCPNCTKPMVRGRWYIYPGVRAWWHKCINAVCPLSR
jgi:hypothetical protein